MKEKAKRKADIRICIKSCLQQVSLYVNGKSNRYVVFDINT